MSCELLSKLYLCNTGYNYSIFISVLFVVVNCFQNCTFVILDTTNQDWHKSTNRCELLSKLYLCNTGYNTKKAMNFIQHVVNCFQNCTFVILDTTRLIAYELKVRCELLSKLYLCNTGYNSQIRERP